MSRFWKFFIDNLLEAFTMIGKVLLCLIVGFIVFSVIYGIYCGLSALFGVGVGLVLTGVAIVVIVCLIISIIEAFDEKKKN